MTTKTMIVVVVSVLVAVAAVVAVKLIFFPSIDDKYFALNSSRLQHAPPGLVIVRPTHFVKGQTGVAYANAKQGTWMVGRNVTLQTLMATAYSQNPAKIVLPSDAPKKNYDFLVTVPKDTQQQMQSAIQRKLGYTAQKETRDTDVMALRIDNPNLPGLKISTARTQSVDMKDGRLCFTHTQITDLLDGLEQAVKIPVVDKTGLTNYYDFSLAWNQQLAQQVQNGTLDPETGKKILGDWGLGLHPDTASVEMLVVKKAR